MSRRVLVIDDSQTMRQLESVYLKQLGFVVDAVPDANSGLQALNPHHNLVITDLNMPGINGLEFVKQLRAGSINQHIPVIIISTESSVNFVESAKKAGVSAWIQKPFTLDQLQVVIQKILPQGDG
jgi:two-component system chemotaxis response regulator CheY